jgi:hypothetical protein
VLGGASTSGSHTRSGVCLVGRLEANERPFLGRACREPLLTMASVLLLRGVGCDVEDRYPLDAGDEELLAPAFRELVGFATSGEQGAIAHERDGELVAAWSREGALRLAQLLPPAYAELANAIRERHQE